MLDPDLEIPRQRGLVTSRWLNSGNLKALALALLLFVYPILALSTASVRYLETIHRVTTQQIFDESVFGSTSGDSLAALGFFLLFLAVTFRSSALRIAMTIAFGAGIGTYLAGYEQILLVAGLITLPLVIALLLFGTLTRNRRSLAATQQTTYSLAGFQVDGKRVAVLFLTIIIILEIGALVRWIAYPIFPSEMYEDPSWKIAELESALFHVFGLLSPVMLVLLAFSFLYKDYIHTLIRKSDFHQERNESTVKVTTPSANEKMSRGYHPTKEHHFSSDRVGTVINQGTSPLVISQSARLSHKSWMHQLVVLSAMIIAIMITLYPHLPGVNQTGAGISTDEQDYVNWLAGLRGLQSQGLATTSFEMISAIFTTISDRPLSILLMLFVGDLTGQSDANVVRFLPSFLAPVLVVTSYCFVRYGFRCQENDKNSKRKKEFIAATVAMAAALSPQIVVGLYGGFLANWLALIPAFLAMLFAVRISDEAARIRNNGNTRRHLTIYLLCFFATLTLTMLFHIYTWGFVILVSLLFTIFSYFSMRKSHSITRIDAMKIVAILVGAIVASIITDVVKSFYFSVSSGLAADSFLAGRSFALGNFVSRWETLDFTLEAYVGGFLSHPGVLMLAFLWVFKGGYLRGFDRLVFSMLFVLSVPLLFGSTVIQARLLYVVPLYIPAVLFLYGAREEKAVVSRFAIVTVVMSLAVYALRGMANLYLVLPEGYELDSPFLAQ